MARLRAEGMSWRRIALALRDETDGELDVTPMTLTVWASRAGLETKVAS